MDDLFGGMVCRFVFSSLKQNILSGAYFFLIPINSDPKNFYLKISKQKYCQSSKQEADPCPDQLSAEMLSVPFPLGWEAVQVMGFQ